MNLAILLLQKQDPFRKRVLLSEKQHSRKARYPASPEAGSKTAKAYGVMVLLSEKQHSPHYI